MCLPALRPIAAVIAADIGPALATVPPAAIVPAVIGVPGAHLRLLRRWQPLPGVLMSRLRPWLVRHRHSMPFFVISRIGKQSCLCSFMAGFLPEAKHYLYPRLGGTSSRPVYRAQSITEIYFLPENIFLILGCIQVAHHPPLSPTMARVDGFVWLMLIFCLFSISCFLSFPPCFFFFTCSTRSFDAWAAIADLCRSLSLSHTADRPSRRLGLGPPPLNRVRLGSRLPLAVVGPPGLQGPTRLVLVAVG